MNRLVKAVSVFLVFAASASMAFAALPAYPSDKDSEAAVRAHWQAKGSILEVKRLTDWGVKVTTENLVQVTRCSATFNVRAREGETTFNARISLSFILTSGAWVYDSHGLIETTTEQRAGVTAPEKAAVKEMIKASIEKAKAADIKDDTLANDDFSSLMLFPIKVDKVLLTDPQFGDEFEKGFHFEYRADAQVVNKKGKAFTIENILVRVHKNATTDANWTLWMKFDIYTKFIQ